MLAPQMMAPSLPIVPHPMTYLLMSQLLQQGSYMQKNCLLVSVSLPLSLWHPRIQLTTVQTKKNKPVVYTGESQATKFCCQSYWRKAQSGCGTLNSFLINPELMSEGESYCVEMDDLQADPVDEIAVEVGLDLIDFCIGQLKDQHLVERS